MYKVSELNPQDTVLDEMHKIQKKISEEDKNLSIKERRNKYNKIREEISRKYKCTLKVVSLEPSIK